MANDKEKLASLLKYVLVSQLSLMPTIARYLGPFLGPRNKMPKPLPDIGPGEDVQRDKQEHTR